MISAFDKNTNEQQESSAAVEIKPRSTSFNAPTPANTPLTATTAPISQKQFKASLAAMSEMPNAASVQAILSQNPQLAAALQGRLGQLVGESSGYIESLPVVVKKRVSALESLQKKHLLLEKEFDLEVAALEKKYEGLYQPLYTRRAEIAKGTSEPTAEELAAFETTASVEEADGAETRGIPEFWLSILKNSPVVQHLVTDVDEAALKHLVDIRSTHLETGPGFRLEFEFEENDYFTNKLLTKTYYLTETEESSSLMFDHCDGCEIDWKSGRDLSVKVEIKKQRHKNSNKTRVVKKTVPNDTFFNFFKAPVVPDEDDEAEHDDEDDEDGEGGEGEDAVQADYEMAEHFKDDIIPEAVDWFTGKATKKFLEQYDDGEDYDDEDGEDYDEDEDDEDDDDEEPVSKSSKPAAPRITAAAAAGAAASPECKQQ